MAMQGYPTRGRTWGALAALSVAAAALLLAACSGSGDGSDPTPATSPTTLSGSPTVVAEATPTVQADGSPLLIGERAEIEGYPDIVVIDFLRSKDAPAASGGGHFEIEPGREFLLLTLRVINDTDLPAGINPFSDLAILSQGVNINQSLTFLSSVEGALEAAVLPPREEAVGVVAWSVPPGFDELAVQYVPFSEAETLEGLPEVTIALE